MQPRYFHSCSDETSSTTLKSVSHTNAYAIMANCSFATAIVAGLLTLLLEVKAVINAFPHDQRMHDSSDRIGRPVRSANISTVSAAFTGDVFMVYNFSSQHCPKLPQPWCKVDIERGCDPDIPDAPVSMWRRTGGDGEFSSSNVSTTPECTIRVLYLMSCIF